MSTFSSSNEDDIEYPRDIFLDMIASNSPYAFYLFQWVDYQADAMRWRLKMLHDVKLKDGSVHTEVYPNGSGWHFSDRRIDDNEVQSIRLSKKMQHPEHEWIDPRPIQG